MSVPVVNETVLAALRADLTQRGFTLEAVADFLGEDAFAAWRQDQRAAALWRCRQQSELALAVLVRVFMLADPVPVLALDAALPRTGVAGLVELALVSVADGQARALAHLNPHGATIAGVDYDWWIASDLGAVAGVRPAGDHVLGIGGATRTLALATPPHPVGAALDLGTGCGVLALYLATHCKRVVATDISARACAFARFNAALNEANIEVRQGDLCTPVAQETFDLIISNPPFVITAERVREGGVLEYRDANMVGDALTGEVVAQVCDRLAAGGHAVLLGNWEIAAERQRPLPEGVPEWARHPHAWLAGRDVAAWVVQRQCLSTVEYVQMWMRDSSAGLGIGGSDSTQVAWLEDFAARGVERIGMGVVVLAAPPRSEHRGRFVPARVFEQIETSTSAPGDYLQRTVDALAQGREVSREDRLVRAEDVREERHYLPGEADPLLVIATQGDGFGQRLRLSSEAAGFLGACDGQLSAGQIVAAIAILTEADPDQLWLSLAGQVEQLRRAGMVWVLGRD